MDLARAKKFVSAQRNPSMILWRNQKIDRLSKKELEFALEDAVLEIERLGRGANEDASYTGYIWGFATASVLAFAGLSLAALVS